MTPGLGAATVVVGLALAAVVWPGASRWHPTGRRAAPSGTPVGESVSGVLPGVDDVADAMVLVALALRTGLPVVDAVEVAGASAHGRTSADLMAVVAALRWGRGMADAWSHAGAVWGPAARAMQMAEATGAAPAALLDAAAGRLREARDHDRERRAARAGVLLVLPLGLGFLPAFACTAVIPLVVVLAAGVVGGP